MENITQGASEEFSFGYIFVQKVKINPLSFSEEVGELSNLAVPNQVLILKKLLNISLLMFKFVPRFFGKII
jgi:hypothetical protein